MQPIDGDKSEQAGCFRSTASKGRHGCPALAVLRLRAIHVFSWGNPEFRIFPESRFHSKAYRLE